ncbi:hypothetical protein D9M73_200910 [compost metagenome]
MQILGGGIDAITANDFGFQAVGCQGQAAAGGGEGVHIEQGQPTLRVASLDGRTQYAGTATEVQHVTRRQLLQVFQQQRGAPVEAAMTEYAWQADDLQRAFGQGQAITLGKAFEFDGLWRRLHHHLPQLAMTGAVEFARLAEGVQLLGRAFDTATFFTHQE